MALLLLSDARAHCAAARSSVVIGLLAPTQEPERESMENGARLAIEDANQLPGGSARLVIRGRPGQWGTDGDEAAALALDEGVGAMIAPLNGAASHQVMQVAGRTRIPVVSLCADTSITGAGIPWVVRIVPGSDLEAKTIFTGLTNIPGKSLTWAAVVPDGRAGREAAGDLNAAAKAAGCRLEEPLRLPPKPEDWQISIRRWLTSKPDVILLWLDPASAGQIAQILRQANFKGLLAGPGRLHAPALVKNAGNAAEGIVVPAVAGPAMDIKDQKQRGNRFAATYRSRFGEEPSFTAAMGYDAATVLIEVLRKADNQPPYRAFPLKEHFRGVSGVITFDKDGNRVATLTLSVCRNGRFQPFN